MSTGVPPNLGRLELAEALAIGGRLEALHETDRRYDERGDPADLDRALAIFDELTSDPSWGRATAALHAEVYVTVVPILRERYEINGDEADLRRAIALAEEAVAITRSAPGPILTASLRLLAWQLSAAFDRDGGQAVIDRAIAALDEARLSPGGERDPELALARGHALLLRFKVFGSRDDADAACAAYQRALELGGAPQARCLDGLGCALFARAELPGSGGDLERAIEVLEQAVDLDPESPWFRVNLAAALGFRFDRQGDRADAERSAALLQSALRDIPPDAPDRRRVEQNALVASAQLSGSASATEAARRIAESTPAGARVRPLRLAALGDSLLLDFLASLDLGALDAAIATQREAVAAAPSGSPDRPSVLDGLGRALTLHYAVLGNAESLEEAIATATTAVETTSPGAPERAQHLLNLGRAMSLRAARTGALEDEADATAHFREACRTGRDGNPGLALAAGRDWATWAAERQAWVEAAEALTCALEAADGLHQLQVGRRHKEAWLSAAPQLASEAAVALARAGDVEAAVLALERGRTRLLADALDRDRAELASLELSPRRDLAAEYRAAAEIVARLDGPDEPETSEGERRSARQALDDVAARIRSVPGHEGFLAPAGLEEVRGAAREAPLAYLAAAETGTAMIVVSQDGGVEAKVLDLDSITVRDWAVRLLTSQAQRDAAPQVWGRAVRELTEWLGEALWPPLAELAGDGPQIVLLPSGLLGLLPLHAAAWRDGATGVRYALDDRLITYAPTARALAGARSAAAGLRADSTLAVGAPDRDDVAPLDYAAAEAEAVRAGFPAGRLLLGREATRAAVRQSLTEHGILHFACHGRVDLRDPLASALLLAGEDVLTLGELLDVRFTRCRLAVLSACETAVAGVTLPDEVVSFPTGLLQAGVPGVIGTLWQVDDRSTMLLVRRFIEELAHGGDPAEALRGAQRWLRDVTNEAIHEAPPDMPEGLRRIWAQTSEHASPEHWAAFTYLGA